MTSGAGITSAAMDAEDGTWDIARVGHTLTPFEPGFFTYLLSAQPS